MTDADLVQMREQRAADVSRPGHHAPGVSAGRSTCGHRVCERPACGLLAFGHAAMVSPYSKVSVDLSFVVPNSYPRPLEPAGFT